MQQALIRLTGSALIAVIGGYLILHLIAPWLDIPAIGDPEGADAIVILGGEIDGRVDLAAALFNAGAAPEVWITGDASSADRVTVGETMRYRAFQAGVPIRRQTLLASTSTLEDAQAIAATARERQARRLILVTSWYHGRRAICTINSQLAGSGITVSYQPAPSTAAPRASWWLRPSGVRSIARELLATAYYSLRYEFTPQHCSSFSASE
ncbi:MAG: YdcF family protein [Oscillochloris sp.]|nr:YdcF family protein [Oscillochloris sp.]